ncbi:hypothetical protein [Nostoc sp. 'Peltigera membranacea cyanobiont' 232]|uniref:hypothetical protein n=1 Tax=Nostoc sp. 'Peltigera membranacea cyanobiont' 232 TaxID=2014531 RepID=UPI00167B2262|nr:hypothetical protein [Nostoc sp. 'Peltigera membranacea cyanobiont' 232]
MSSLEIASSLNRWGIGAIAKFSRRSDRPIFIGQFVVLSAQHSHSRIGEASYYVAPSQ